MSTGNNDTNQENHSSQADYGREEPRMFQANNQYFTIAVYAVMVILAGVLIIRLILSWDETVAAIRKTVSVLMPFLIGGLIAFILNPAVKKLCRVLGHFCHIKDGPLRTGLAIAITYLLVIGLIGVALFGIVPQLVESIMELVNYIPRAVNEIYLFVDNLEEHFPGIDMEVLRTTINNAIPDMINYIRDFATNLVPALYTISMSIVSWIINLLIAVIVSIYMLADKKPLLRSTKAIIYGFIPMRNIHSFLEILRDGNKIFSGFIIGKSIDSLIIGILCFILMNILGLDYAVLISVIVGVTNMIPYFGPFIGAIPGILILLLISPVKALIFGILILVLQQFDGLILGPKILGDSTGLKPLWIIVAITIGGSIAGVLGMFLGVPVIAFLRYLLDRLLKHRLCKRGFSDMEQLYNE